MTPGPGLIDPRPSATAALAIIVLCVAWNPTAINLGFSYPPINCSFHVNDVCPALAVKGLSNRLFKNGTLQTTLSLIILLNYSLISLFGFIIGIAHLNFIRLIV